MDYIAYGETGITTSVAGLGCGGSSRLGQGRGESEDHSVGIVLKAYDLGVTFLDTAQAYGTETIVGKAIAQLPREDVVISSKTKATRRGEVLSEAEVVAAVDRSLADLGTEYIDIYHLHSLSADDYPNVVEQVVPVLVREQEKGKIRVIGATESGPKDPHHKMLDLAVPNGPFRSIGLAFNMMNQRAHDRILPDCRTAGIGSMTMFAVRAVFSVPGRLQRDVAKRVAAGELPAWLAEKDNPLDFLLHAEGAESLTDAAYRYVRHKEATDVILFGTGNPDHLKSNVASILRPPLPETDITKLEDLFAHLVGFGADLPEPVKPKV